DALHNTGAERVAVTVYGLTLLAIRILGSALDAYARREHLYSPQADGDQVQVPRRKLLPVVIGYVIAILIGLLVPLAAVALYFGMGVSRMVRFRQVARLLIRRLGAPAGQRAPPPPLGSWRSSRKRAMVPPSLHSR